MSSMFAICSPGVFCSTNPLYDQCICQTPSSPGDEKIVVIGPTAAPLRVPFCTSATRGWSPCTNGREPDAIAPWLLAK